MTAQPTPTRMLFALVATLLVAVAAWWVVEWRSAPPPPPAVELPKLPSRP